MNFQISTPTPFSSFSNFGGRAADHEYAVANRYLTRDGKPFIYRMGEFGFSGDRNTCTAFA